MEVVSLIFLTVVMAIVAITDVKNRKIPNKVILPSICLALFLQIIQFHWLNIIIAIVVTLLLSIVYTINENFIGGGDIKMFLFVILLLGQDLVMYLQWIGIFSIILWIIYFIKEKITKEKQVLPLAASVFLAIITQLAQSIWIS